MKCLLGSLLPSIPEIFIFPAIGDETECVSHLLLIEFTKRPRLVHPAIRRINFRRTGGAAEMPDGASAAGFNVLDKAAGHFLERRAFKNIFQRISE